MSAGRLIGAAATNRCAALLPDNETKDVLAVDREIHREISVPVPSLPAGDYRTLYARRKAEMEERAAAAKERIAAAYQLANQDRESRKAKVRERTPSPLPPPRFPEDGVAVHATAV